MFVIVPGSVIFAVVPVSHTGYLLMVVNVSEHAPVVVRLKWKLWFCVWDCLNKNK